MVIIVLIGFVYINVGKILRELQKALNDSKETVCSLATQFIWEIFL